MFMEVVNLEDFHNSLFRLIHLIVFIVDNERIKSR
jgi:hypothetical protein